eukprot:gb/GECH01010058.1/.p1 GENE.gb/GECH01010058.1/~~gb/GECH01010058.1/.p1  ORF type:complete len:348 (+),score=17.08 gb/GECH01010058.1/:1-1044(+)
MLFMCEWCFVGVTDHPLGTYNPKFLDDIASSLKVTYDETLVNIFSQYIKKKSIDSKNPKMVVVSIDEFSLSTLCNRTSNKQNLKILWQEMLNISRQMASKGLIIKWIWSGKEIGFLDVVGNMTQDSPSYTHWITLECLESSHVRSIIYSSFWSIHSRLTELQIVETTTKRITEFTSGVPRYVVYLCHYLVDHLEDLCEQNLESLLAKASRHLSLSAIRHDFFISQEWKSNITLRKLVMLVKMLDRFEVVVNENAHFKIDNKQYTAHRIVNMLPIFIKKYTDENFILSVPPLIISNIPDSPFYSVLSQIDSFPPQLLDSGEILEFSCAISLYNLSDLAKNQPIGKFLS